MKEFELALRVSPRDQNALRNLAEAYRLLGRAEDAARVEARVEDSAGGIRTLCGRADSSVTPGYTQALHRC